MITLSAGEIARIVNGGLLASSSVWVTSPPTLDSRKVTPGALFLAVKGEKVDGHDFAQDAIDRGATLILSSRELDFPCVVVKDVQVALALLAQHVRSTLTNLIVIGITGSQGKTTTKDLLSWTLNLVGSTIATEGSLNNEFGLPLTILRCDERTRFCVLEMGARHEGDIAHLCQISQPNIGVVLNVGSAHVGEFGSRDKIARTKSELFENLKLGGTAISGMYDPYTSQMFQNISHPNLSSLTSLNFGQTTEAQIRASDVDIREGRAHFDLVTPAGRAAVALRLIGEHQVANALAAAAVCTVLEIPLDVIATGLSTAEISSHWRMEIHELPDLLVINDSYNANPESTSAALKTLSLFSQARGGQSWAFLGKMHELGQSASEEHSRVGALAGELGVDHLICVNSPEYAEGSGQYPEMTVHLFRTKEEAQSLSEHFSRGDVVLVKGSRAEKMEELSEILITNWQVRVSADE